jgi:hypothetical protein
MPVTGWQTTACDDIVNSKVLQFLPSDVQETDSHGTAAS